VLSTVAEGAAPAKKKESKSDSKAMDESEDGDGGGEAAGPAITAVPYVPITARASNVKKNEVRFTPMQVEAIKSGLNNGLTMVVGPPGTGKTDTAVQVRALSSPRARK
jgi:intron-binding protein aquarius